MNSAQDRPIVAAATAAHAAITAADADGAAHRWSAAQNDTAVQIASDSIPIISYPNRQNQKKKRECEERERG